MEAKGKAIVGVLMVLLVLTVGAVYAILSSIQVQNNVSITAGVALGVQTSTTDPSTCPGLGNGSYGTITPFTNTVKWNITAGGSQTQWFCVENQGSGNDNTPMIKLTSIPSTITCSSSPCLILTTNPATLAALPAQTVSAPINVTISAPVSALGSGTVEINVS